MENSPTTKKSFSLDWLVRGTLTKLGEMFDKLTGRNWQPSSNLATSELTERLKKLLDAEVKDLGALGRFVPHHIRLLMQWDKFSTDAETSLKKLENELHIAAIDHINDRRYQTYAPLEFEIKTDYFTEGVKLQTSFGKFAEKFDERQGESDGEMNVSVPDLKNIVLAPPEEIEPEKEVFTANFVLNGKPRNTKLTFTGGERRSVGRTKENDLWLDDESVSKNHASLALNAEKQLMVADTGSTNGTFINGNRLAYGRAFAVSAGDKLSFGTVEVAITHLTNSTEETISADGNESGNTELSKTIDFNQADDSDETVTSRPTEPIISLNLNETRED